MWRRLQLRRWARLAGYVSHDLTGRTVRGPCQGRSMRRARRAIPHCSPDLSMGKADKHPSSFGRIWVRTAIEVVSGGPLRTLSGHDQEVLHDIRNQTDSK